MINECSNSWLGMVPTIEGGNPRGARAARDAKRVACRAEGATQPVIVSLVMSCKL